MRTHIWRELDEESRRALLARPARRRDAALIARVEEIISDVEKRGVDAVNDWSMRIDGAPLARLRLDHAAVDAARAGIAAEDLAALEIAADHVARYHAATAPQDQRVEIGEGVICERRWRAIASCGLYVPGGSAPLFSTLLMLALPARAAGVSQRIAVTPPGKDGGANPVMIAAAALCGLEDLFLVGGAQAIAALGVGAGLPKAEKIFGPGNAWVAEAKRQIAARGLAAIDLPAGPSELMAIADEAADPDSVAADLLSQAEHDADAQVMLVATSPAIAARVSDAIWRQLAGLPRAAIARDALMQSSFVVVNDLDEAAEVANAYAPEHLALHVENADKVADRIENAGAVFVGGASAEVFGDYVCGPSHVLPTDGAARAFSGVTTASFMKSLSLQRLKPTGAAALAPFAARLARMEGLEAHARAAERRL